MIDGQRSIVTLLLIDNTANMACSNERGLPYLSFAKVLIQNTKNELERSKFKTTLLVAIANNIGDPVVYVFDQQRKADFNISSLDVSPTGSFSDIINEGMNELNKLRANNERDLVDPYFFPRRSDNYFIFILSDIATINQSIALKTYSYNRFRENVFRPDEHILLLDYVSRQDPPNVELLKSLRAEYHSFQFAYDILSVSRGLTQVHPFFNFSIDFDDNIIDCFLDFASYRSQWPLPDQKFSENLFPIYKAHHIDSPPTSSSLSFPSLSKDEFFIRSSGRNPPEGYYMLTSDDIPFAWIYLGNESTLTPLPYNYPELYSLLSKVPGRDQCDRYISSVPYCYVDPIKSLFKSLQLSFTYEPTKLRNEQEIIRNDRNRALNYRDSSYLPSIINLDPAQISEDALSILLEDLPEAMGILPTVAPEPFFVNTDTADDAKWTSILPFQERSLSTMQSYFLQTPSPISFEALRKYIPHDKTTNSQSQSRPPSSQFVPQQSEKHEIEESVYSPSAITDDPQLAAEEPQMQKQVRPKEKSSTISLIEDLTILLRQKKLVELEGRISELKVNAPLHKFVVEKLLAQITRFGLQKYMSQSFMEKLQV